MAGSTSKKVRISRFEREALLGFVNPLTYLRPAGVELLTPDGNYSVVPYDEVKAVQFVKDFEPPDPYSNNQRLFLPRAALTELQVLGVVGSPLRRPKPKPVVKEQIGLFD